MGRLHGRRDGPGGMLLDWVIDYSQPSAVATPLGSLQWLIVPADYKLSLRGLGYDLIARVTEVAPEASVSSTFSHRYPGLQYDVSGIQLTPGEVQAIASGAAGPVEVLLRREQAAWPHGYRLTVVPDALHGYS